MVVSTKTGKQVEVTAVAGHGAVAPLENGDRLTRAEFERRYDAMPHVKKAELIEGEVYMPSPSPARPAQLPAVTACYLVRDLSDRDAWGRRGRQRQHPPRRGQRTATRRLSDRSPGSRWPGSLQRGRLHRRCSRAGRRSFLEQRQLRPGKKVERLPAMRRSRVHCLAGARPRNRLVREPRRAIRAPATLSRWHPAQPRFSRALARSDRVGSRAEGDGQASPRARLELIRTCRVRGPARADAHHLSPSQRDRPSPRSEGAPRSTWCHADPGGYARAEAACPWFPARTCGPARLTHRVGRGRLRRVPACAPRTGRLLASIRVARLRQLRANGRP